jgi:hypothetical protein
VNLADLVRSEGYGFVVDPTPWLRGDVLGSPVDPHCFDALACNGPNGLYVACRSLDWDWVYACSHEIAEARMGFKHTLETFEYQAQILAGWVRKLATKETHT